MILHAIPSSLEREREQPVLDRSRPLANNNARRTTKAKSSSRPGSTDPVERKVKKVKGTKQTQRPKARNRVPVQSSAERKKATRSVKPSAIKPSQRKASTTTVLPTSSTSPVPSDQTTVETEAKQHTFPKRDRTTSLMALQTLAEKIAQYKKKYGETETRNSSLITPPKRLKKQKRT